MDEYLEPFGVRSTVFVHLREEGQASYDVHPDEDRAVICLETSAVRFHLFVSRDSLSRVGQVIADAQAELDAAVSEKAAA